MKNKIGGMVVFHSLLQIGLLLSCNILVVEDLYQNNLAAYNDR